MCARVQDVVALLGRIGVGAVFLTHGVQKWDMGLDGVTNMTSGMGISLPTVSALFLIAVDTAGAIAFILGLALPLRGSAFAVGALGALFFVHLGNGLTGQGGYELVLALAAGALAPGFNGCRLPLDHLLFWRKRGPRPA